MLSGMGHLIILGLEKFIRMRGVRRERGRGREGEGERGRGRGSGSENRVIEVHTFHLVRLSCNSSLVLGVILPLEYPPCDRLSSV